MELILVILSTFTLWVAGRPLLPFSIHPKLAPFAIGGIAYGVTEIHFPHVVLALAVVTGVSLLMILVQLAGIDELPGPWSFHGIRSNLPRWPRSTRTTGVGHTPGEAPGGRGRRIPKLLLGCQRGSQSRVGASEGQPSP